jgi:hypothetical protein
MGWIINFLRAFFPNLFSRASLWVGGLFTALAPAVTAQFVKLTSNLGKIVAGIAAIGLFMAAFTAVLYRIGNGLSAVLPGQFVQFGQMFIPDNTAICVSALVSAKLAQVIMVWKVRLAEFFMGA